MVEFGEAAPEPILWVKQPRSDSDETVAKTRETNVCQAMLQSTFDFKKYDHPVSSPQKVNRGRFSSIWFLQLGVAYMVLGGAITAGIYVVNGFHPLDSSYRAGLLGASEGFILIGALTLVGGWFRPRNEEKKTGPSR